jgi:hypothetical protein
MNEKWYLNIEKLIEFHWTELMMFDDVWWWLDWFGIGEFWGVLWIGISEIVFEEIWGWIEWERTNIESLFLV